MSLPAVLLSGLQSDRVSWQRLPDLLAVDRTVTVPGGHHVAGSIAGMTDRLLPQCPERFHLVGWSMGGYIALEFLRRVPGRITSLVLMDTTAAPESEVSRRRRAEALVLARRAGMGAYQRANFARCIHAPTHLPPRTLEMLADEAEALGLAAFEAQIAAIIARRDSQDDLARSTVPLLIVTGDNDQIIAPEHSRQMQALRPDARLAQLPECGHCPPIEAPEVTAALLRDWFTETEAGTALNPGDRQEARPGRSRWRGPFSTGFTTRAAPGPRPHRGVPIPDAQSCQADPRAPKSVWSCSARPIRGRAVWDSHLTSTGPVGRLRRRLARGRRAQTEAWPP